MSEELEIIQKTLASQRQVLLDYQKLVDGKEYFFVEGSYSTSLRRKIFNRSLQSVDQKIEEIKELSDRASNTQFLVRGVCGPTSTYVRANYFQGCPNYLSPDRVQGQGNLGLYHRHGDILTVDLRDGLPRHECTGHSEFDSEPRPLLVDCVTNHICDIRGCLIAHGAVSQEAPLRRVSLETRQG